MSGRNWGGRRTGAGRPRLKWRKRSVRIGLSVAPADFAELTKRAGDRSVTDYVYRLVVVHLGRPR